MTSVTLQLVDGIGRGRIYANLETPFTIGREEENAVQLNDERVSRFHAKIQEEDGRIILTDLESTNGTRVNGHPIPMRILQPGDQIGIGRSLLIFGNRGEIDAYLKAHHPQKDDPAEHPLDRTIHATADAEENVDFEVTGPIIIPHDVHPDEISDKKDFFPHGPPGLPDDLRAFQIAILSDFLAYTHDQILNVLQSAVEELGDEESPRVMQVDWPAWQRLLNLEMDLALSMRKLTNPGEELSDQ